VFSRSASLVSAGIAAFAGLAGCASAGGGAEPGVDAPPGSIDAPPGSIDGAIDGAPSACDLALASLGTGFESGAAGWTHVVLDGASAPGWPLDEWQVGAATSGPGSCRTGTGCWATRLDANYTSCERAALISPMIDLSMCAGDSVNVTFWSWHDFWTGTVSGKPETWYDGGLVEVSPNGSSWQAVTPSPAYPGTVAINPNISSYSCVSQNNFYVHGKAGWVGTSGGWKEVTVPIPTGALTSSFRLRFAFSSGVSFANNNAETNRSHTRPGWYIDDLSFSAP
jgi:hypothetical protein